MFRRETSSDPKWMFASEELATSVCKRVKKTGRTIEDLTGQSVFSLSLTLLTCESEPQCCELMFFVCMTCTSVRRDFQVTRSQFILQ